MTRLLFLPALLALAMAPSACRRDAPPAQAPAPSAPAPAAPAARAPLEDIVEATPRYVVGVSFPKAVARYPGLATALEGYAASARKDLMVAVEGIGNDVPTAPYELSLSFATLHESPRLVAVAADGHLYTGGAHAAPLLARFVWLVPEQRMLTAPALVPQAASWQAISDFVREQLHTALSQRVDADELPAAERAEMLENAGRMIDEGTGPEAASFSQFEPVVGPGGRLAALRFVFAPYQVGPYADGVQTVDVPAEVLLPHVAPAYRELFGG